MIKISPKQIKGKWTYGYALDFHTLSSEFIGYNEYGYPQFDSKYSDMGELLNRLKYKSDKSVIRIIIETVAEFLDSRNWPVDLIVPVPPSREARPFQPVISIAKDISNTTTL
jgi:predicted amidophosphoribosyltransferase